MGQSLVWERVRQDVEVILADVIVLKEREQGRCHEGNGAGPLEEAMDLLARLSRIEQEIHRVREATVQAVVRSSMLGFGRNLAC